MAGSKQDMGTGSVKKLMVKMAVPALIGHVVNLLYNIVDRIYIGHLPEIGGAALTGVGLFTPILMLITAFAMLAGAGGAPRAAIAMGQCNKEKAEQIQCMYSLIDKNAAAFSGPFSAPLTLRIVTVISVPHNGSVSFFNTAVVICYFSC